uniref:DB domain-containing protein n=1 Tax=Steinernema glaseri TaxID=37863 RepID=A0A1I7ZLV9_9BILA
MMPQLPSASFTLSVALVLVAFLPSANSSAADNLPPCDSIPKLLCCTERVMEKCLSGCIDYVSSKCPHKLEKFEKIAEHTVEEEPKREVKPSRPVNAPYAGFPEETRAALQEQKPRVHGVGAVDGAVRAPSETRSASAPLPSEGFLEQNGPSKSAPSRSGGDYDLVRSQYPITEVSDADLSGECGTARSKPPFSPCLSRKNVDDLFLSCCQQHVPSNCHSLCQYEHREHVAAETLISAVQTDGCDLKYLSKVLYCANQNRDNRQCCRTLGLNGSELGVGDRCLRMCNIARSGDRVGTIEKNDLVCLSNWNVVMYCARAGIRTIN